MRAQKGMSVLHNPFVVLVEVAMFVVEMPRNHEAVCPLETPSQWLAGFHRA